MKQYKDIDDNEVTLKQLVRKEPDWACSRIRVCEKLEKVNKGLIQRFENVIKCQSCNGVGFYLGDNLGVGECPDCGGDGHRLYGMEGITLEDIMLKILKGAGNDTTIQNG